MDQRGVVFVFGIWKALILREREGPVWERQGLLPLSSIDMEGGVW